MAAMGRKIAGRAAAPRARALAAQPSNRARLRTAHDELVATKANLEATTTSLLGIDPDSLSDAEHKRWTEAINQVDLAIARVRSSLLNGIAEEFAAELPDIQKSTASLRADLAKVNKAVQIINIVASALGIVEQIIRLGR